METLQITLDDVTVEEQHLRFSRNDYTLYLDLSQYPRCKPDVSLSGKSSSKLQLELDEWLETQPVDEPILFNLLDKFQSVVAKTLTRNTESVCLVSRSQTFG